MLLRGHRLPWAAALSQPCPQRVPLLQRPGAHFPSVRVKFLLKRSSVLLFTRRITDGHGAGPDSPSPGFLLPHKTTGSLKEGAFPVLFQLSIRFKAQTFFQQRALPQDSQEVLPSWD